MREGKEGLRRRENGTDSGGGRATLLYLFFKCMRHASASHCSAGVRARPHASPSIGCAKGGKSLNMTTAAWAPQASLATRRGDQRPCEWTNDVGRGKFRGLPRGPSAPSHATGGLLFFLFFFFLSFSWILILAHSFRLRPPPKCGGCGPNVAAGSRPSMEGEGVK